MFVCFVNRVSCSGKAFCRIVHKTAKFYDNSLWLCSRLKVTAAAAVIRAGLTIWWALRTPQRRGPTGKLDAKEGPEGESGARDVPLPSQLIIKLMVNPALAVMLSRFSAVTPLSWKQKINPRTAGDFGFFLSRA